MGGTPALGCAKNPVPTLSELARGPYVVDTGSLGHESTEAKHFLPATLTQQRTTHSKSATMHA